jgi:hypothetical protein
MVSLLLLAFLGGSLLVWLFIFFGGLELLHLLFFPNQEGDSGKRPGPQFDEEGNVTWPGEKEE